MNKRHLVLGTVLAVTLAATWWASTVEDDDGLAADDRAGESRPVATRPARAATRSVAQDLSPLASQRAPFDAQAPALFGRPAPVVAPVVRRAPPPPPVARAPSAPPLPYTYIGSLKEEGRSAVVFLMRGQEFVSARVGGVLEKNYRIQSVDETGVTLIYLPLGLTQRIELADRS